MPTTEPDDVHRAAAYLVRVAERPAAAVSAFVDQVGLVDAAAHVRAGTAPAAVANETSARRHHDLVDDDFAAAARVGARLIVPGDDEWPTRQLDALANLTGVEWAVPPVGLWVRGPAPLAEVLDRAVSVIGARAASGYGEHVATDFGHGLAQEGVTVLSGAGYGIDGAAHRGALAAEGSTVAVLGCGIDIAYPAGHTQLLERITATGLLVTEYPPGTPPARYRFLIRNRLTACLTAGTVIVEASHRSSCRTTAASAAALGRVVMAVPGPITSSTSYGTHRLLRDGAAIPVASVSDLLESLGAADTPPAPNTDARERVERQVPAV